jgi:beta-N-acetylhexosaminidase
LTCLKDNFLTLYVLLKTLNSRMFKKVLVSFFFCLLWQITFAQSARTHWVDSVFRTLNANERIGQLFLVPVSNKTDDRTINEIENLIKSHEIGGLIFQNLSATEQARLANHFQSIANVPLFIALGGDLTSVLDSAIHYPSPHILGAIQHDSLLYQLGATVANQLKMVGVNVFFSPETRVANGGVDASPEKNSFGQDKREVARKSLAVMRGLQDNGIIACAQYLPLKGITVLDIRKELPVLETTIDTLQAFPYVTLMSKGLKGIMPAAAEFPIFYKDVNAAKKSPYSSTTLSSLYTAEWVKKNTNFEGLIFVDLGKIEHINSDAKDGEKEMFAFQRGNDVLMNPGEIGPAIRRIKKLLRKESNYESQLETTVKKILSSKFESGLWKSKTVNTDNLATRVNSVQAKLLNRKLYESAVTIVRNEDQLLPIKVLEGKKFTYISTHSSESNYTFFEYLKRYVNVSYQTIEDKTDENELEKSLRTQDIIFVSAFPETGSETLKRLTRIFENLDSKSKIVICDFGNPFIWALASKFPGMVTAYDALDETFVAVPQIIFGAVAAEGKLSFTPSTFIPSGSGIQTQPLHRLAYSLPEDVKMNSTILSQIDSIAWEAIRMGATPGCQVLVARKGKVIYEKNFGSLTYDKKLPVTDETIYDLASVTKVMATLQTAMFMQERGLLDLNKKVSAYLPELKKSNKKDITMMDMLTHQAGLVPFLPLYNQTMKDTIYLPHYYSRTRSSKYPMQVGQNLYASPVLKDSVWSWIVKSKLVDKPARTPYSYKYSDFGFLILQRIAETLLNQPMDDFLAQNLYEPLGAYTTGFTPLTRFPQQSIAPTEDDKIYRKSFVSGTVHDERAAMLGGVAGHAGLFSTANDLAKVGQMLLQEGSYGGVQYYRPETVRLFTAKKYKNSRRGIGWDKPIPSDPGTLTSFYASPSTFGHTGFTGTCIWIDPEFDLVYIFLSNRVYPDRNNKLSNANIRSRIQDVIYKSIFGFEEEENATDISNPFAINDGASRP